MVNHLKKAGFTLTEVMIAVVLIGIIAGLAVPTYFTTIEQSRANEARSSLFTIWMAQKIYRLNNNRFYPPGSTQGTLATINTDLNTEISSQFYTYSITANNVTGAGAQFTASADRTTSTKLFEIVVTGSDTTPPTVTESGSY